MDSKEDKAGPEPSTNNEIVDGKKYIANNT